MGYYDRTEALAWWRGMTKEEQYKKAEELAPDKPFEFINTSSSWIFRLWQINLVITAMADSSAHTRRPQ